MKQEYRSMIVLVPIGCIEGCFPELATIVLFLTPDLSSSYYQMEHSVVNIAGLQKGIVVAVPSLASHKHSPVVACLPVLLLVPNRFQQQIKKNILSVSSPAEGNSNPDTQRTKIKLTPLTVMSERLGHCYYYCCRQ